MTQSDCVEKAHELGFDAVEFTDIAGENYDEQLKNAKDIRERADKIGIEINAYTIGACLYNETEDKNKAEIERLKKQLDIAKILEPKLTTLCQDTAAIGRIAAEKLIDLIENPKTTLIDRFSVDGTLFKGASVKKIKK